MVQFLENLLITAKEYPDRTAVVDHDGNRTTTYRELVEKACRDNAWLRSKQIGREQVAALYFPKGVEYIAARLGIIMSGGRS